MLLDSKRFSEHSLAKNSTAPRLLNVGCGSHYHKDWTNLDLISDNLDVIPHDLTCGIPYSDDHFDAVYHSHVLEHLKPTDGIKLLKECFRVLKPGGILRVVVPDLERIAELYLEMHDKAWSGNADAKNDYDWMKLELLDQLVREHSGGQMGQFMSNPRIQNSEFVQSRVGHEFKVCRTAASGFENAKKNAFEKINDWTKTIRQNLAKKVVRLLLGSTAERAFSEGLFRNSGEVHRWMYDRFSLRETCEEIGFENFEIVSAPVSQIQSFSTYQLDVFESHIRKPDSLFTECRKPVKTLR
ncbi:MAG: methyltransferase domain-containing protein [Planctomycetota bacterium]